ncbi:uncharacterized protein EI90DRAFT_3020789 [Cantharellus anzutake]|uniref:uncharacterized protein n=1 Tax=Cantharellus anzutake TaxID=1750568 RepID=UPI001902EF9E|nr:uncharacterized protein EI90DRAFT_3020789 [Cantharellus anzutake]KAF8319494.1 hypothetical protein EI90DRAFT_3020789 [Cantharellus anzutake]
MRFIAVASILFAAASCVLAHGHGHGCSSSQFSWTIPGTNTHICLPKNFHGDGDSPSDKECPEGWAWSGHYKVCVPKTNRPRYPSCPHGDWDFRNQCCHKPTGTKGGDHPKPSHRLGHDDHHDGGDHHHHRAVRLNGYKY